mgnify:CR=1 FL=1
MFAWTSKGDLWHVLSPVAVVPPWGEYYPRLCTREQFEKLVLVDVLLEQTQGGLALASNSYGYGGHFSHSLRLGAGNPISFTASVSPECEFVRWEFYASGEETPFLTVNKTRVDMHWTEAANAIVRAVTRPKDEYKLRLETKVADPGTPGDDCPGYVVVEDAKTIGSISYHGPKRYYPKDGWVRLRPVANPGYRFVKWQTAEDVTGAVLFFGIPFMETGINEIAEERIAVRMDDDTTLRAVFEPHITLQFGLSEGGPYKDVDPPDLRSIHEHPDYELASDNVPVWIGALTQDTVWFRVPQMQNCGDTISWTGAASGTGWRKSVYFDAAGDFEVTATWGELTRTARVKVCTYPDESRLDWAADHHDDAIVLYQYAKMGTSWRKNKHLGGGFLNGRQNACQHSYWTALAAFVLGYADTIEGTNAHEHDNLENPGDNPPAKPNECVMDMLNNEIGSSIGSELDYIIGTELRNILIGELNGGHLWMLSVPDKHDELAFLLKSNALVKSAESPNEDIMIPSPRENPPIEPYWENDPGPYMP